MGAQSSKIETEVYISKKPSFNSSWKQLSHGSSHSASALRRDEELIVQIMMPLYFTEDPVRFQDVFEAKLSWDKILKDVSPEYEVRRTRLPYACCREWFEAAFYERLFDVHPVSASKSSCSCPAN
jgi:hypothetical protein